MKTILCIDDDAWVLDTLRQALIPRGYRVLVTTSTDAGPGFLKHEKVDLVLLDLNMPKKHGLQVFRELEASAPVPVLFVTGCDRSFRAQSETFPQMLAHLRRIDPKVPVVVITGAEPLRLRRAFLNHPVEQLHKPLGLRQIQRVLNQLTTRLSVAEAR